MVHSIPKTRHALKPGENVGVDLRIRLDEGQEYFKAIVTSEPVDWENLNIGTFKASFKGEAGRGFAAEAVEKTRACEFWSAGSLRVDVGK